MAETRLSLLPTRAPGSSGRYKQEKIDLDGVHTSTDNGNKQAGKVFGIPIVMVALKIALIALGFLSLLIFGISLVFGVFDKTPPKTIKLEFHPNLGKSFIWIDLNEQKNHSPYAVALTKYFNTEYVPANIDERDLNCAYGGTSSTEDVACLIDLTSFHRACTKENAYYGYDQGKGAPCILITPTKISGWKPEPYKTLDDLVLAKKHGVPERIVDKVQKYINQSPANPMLDTIWITCDGETGVDRENIGELEYYSPAFKNEQFQGIPGYYFPYNGQRNFKMPFVFVKFLKPQHNVFIRIECKAWAKNIIPENGYGKVLFDLMID